MTRIVIRELVWDKWNVEHVKKHSVGEEEIVESVRNTVYHRKAHSGRYLNVGRTGTRIITIIIRRQKTGTYYLVTARDSNKKERRDLYEKEQKTTHK